MILGQDGNHLVNLIVLIAIVFVLFSFIYVIYRMSDISKEVYMESVFRPFILPADLSVLLTKPWTLFTYMWMHFSVWHVLGNLLWLWAFGFILQDLAGNGKIIPLFLYGGFAGGIIFLLAYNLIPLLIRDMPASTLEGASAGVMSVALATTTLAPKYRILPMLNGGIPLWVFTAIFVVIDFASIPTSNTGGHLAHLAGALVGFIYVLQLKKGRDPGAWLNRFFDWCINLFNPSRPAKKIRQKHFYKVGATKPFNKVPNITQQRIDTLLDKINQKGYNSLTSEEKEILKRAAQDDNL